MSVVRGPFVNGFAAILRTILIVILLVLLIRLRKVKKGIKIRIKIAIKSRRGALGLSLDGVRGTLSAVSLPKTSSGAEACAAQRVATPEEAVQVSAFLLQPDLFGTPLTPGEQEEFKTHPAAAIGCADDGYWYVRDAAGAICAVIGVRMNVERTGIFEVSALAIHAGRRGQGLGRRLLGLALDFVAEAKGRGLLFETSSDPSYAPMHKLLADLAFKQVGRFPDFYYPGEDTLWYYRAIER